MPTTTDKPITFEAACRRYVNRYTMEHVPKWATQMRSIEGKWYAPQFRTDQEWYDNTIFPEGKDKKCITVGATFPLGQWLDEPFKKGSVPVPPIPTTAAARKKMRRLW
jgi:hypothetical protein